MRHLQTVTLAVMMGLSGLVLATEPAAIKKSARSVANSSCRNVTDLEGKVRSYCGSVAQWHEFDIRMAKRDHGFSCRSVKDSQPLCLFARQWEYVDRMYSPQRGSINSDGFGAAAGQMLAMSINSIGNPAIR